MKSISKTEILRFNTKSGLTALTDILSIEEPLEIRVLQDLSENGRRAQRLSLTMRTPGNDLDLVRGFLLSEGIIENNDEILKIKNCGSNNIQYPDNVAVAWISKSIPLNLHLEKLKRNFSSNSSCGLCGKNSLEALNLEELNACAVVHEGQNLDHNFILKVLEKFSIRQDLFSKTGSLHATALFSLENAELLTLHEDIGRHNAMDKSIGYLLKNNPDQLKKSVALLSGRVSWELMQKAIRANIPCILALGAPSQLAVDLAKRFNISLLGFVKKESFNIYHNNGLLNLN